MSTQDFRKYSTSSATGTITPEPPFPSYPNKCTQENDVYQNYKQPPPNYSSAVQPQPVLNLNTQLQTNNSFGSTMQYGNNYNNQTNFQKTVPPTPPPDSSRRCMTPSSIKPGI